MAHLAEIGLPPATVIAEGVSAEQPMDLLRRADCDYGQGYLFCRPIPAVAFEQWGNMWEPEQLLSIGA